MSDLLASIIWWGIVLLGGAAVWPFAVGLFPSAGSGFSVAKVLFPGIAGLFFVWFGTARIVPFRPVFVWLILLAVGLIAWLNKSRRGRALAVLRQHWKSLAAFELLFLILFALGIYLRGHLPGLDSLEKMMNIGFLNSLNRTGFLPAADMWFAGKSINYYYGGHLAVSVWIKLGGIAPATAYNLAMATVFALTGVLSFQIGHAVLTRPRVAKHHRVLPLISGASTCLLVTLGSNGHPILYDPASPLAFIGRFFTTRWPRIAGQMETFWFPNSTRYIGYNPVSADKTIHEFPAYSFLVADLHAHLINLVFVLAFLLFIVNWFATSQSSVKYALSLSPDNRSENRHLRVLWAQAIAFLRALLSDPVVIVTAFFLYLFQISNYWDFVMYFALFAFTLLVSRRYAGRMPLFSSGRSAVSFVVQAGGLLAVFLFVPSPLMAAALYLLWTCAAVLLAVYAPSRLTLAGAVSSVVFALSHSLALPFNRHFEPIGKTVRLVEQRTSIYQFFVLWGLMLALAVAIVAAVNISRDRPAGRLLFVLASGGLLFLLVPELAYVVDIYGGDFMRANTMFKFTYQAFVLLMLVIGCGPSLLLTCRRTAHRLGAAVMALLSLTFLWFPVRAAKQWFGPIAPQNYIGLDGTAPLRTKLSLQIQNSANKSLSDYFAVIDWLNRNEPAQPVLLEANGPSYTDYCLVSAFTGLPTVLGWETHEWLWRTTTKTPEAYQAEILPRQREIADFYRDRDTDRMHALLDRYDIKYVVVGPLEAEMFSVAAYDPIWAQIGDVAFQSGDVVLLRVLD